MPSPPPSPPQPLHHPLLDLDYHSIKKNISTPSADLSPKPIVWTPNKNLQLLIFFSGEGNGNPFLISWRNSNKVPIGGVGGKAVCVDEALPW